MKTTIQYAIETKHEDAKTWRNKLTRYPFYDTIAECDKSLREWPVMTGSVGRIVKITTETKWETVMEVSK